MATNPNSNWAPSGSDTTGGGYKCGCGAWVPTGYAHACHTPWYTPAQHWYAQPYPYVDMKPVIDAIEKLTKAVEELQDIIASDK